MRAARRRTRRIQQLLALVATLALAAGALAAYAFDARSSANQARDEALSRQVAIEAKQLRATDPALAAQLALASYRIAPTVQARSTLIEATGAEMPYRLLGPVGPEFLASDDHGRLLAVAQSATDTVELYSLAGGRPTPRSRLTVGPRSEQDFTVALSPDGRLLAAGDTAGKVVVWNVADPAHPSKLATQGGQYYGAPFIADLSVLWYNKTLFRSAGLNPDDPPASYAQIVSDAKKISALGHGISGFSFAGDCQGCLGFTMLPSVWAAGQHLISGPLGSQTADVAGNAPLKQILSYYRQLWADHLVPVADQTQNGLSWGDRFEAGKVGILPGDYGIAAKFTTAAQKAEFADAPLPAVSGGGYATFDGANDFSIPQGAANWSGAWEVMTVALQRKQQCDIASLHESGVRWGVHPAATRAASRRTTPRSR